MKITCSVPGRAAKVVLAASAFLVGAVAHATPTISIVSPGLGVTVRNDPKPTVAVTYSSDDPSAPLDLASLVVTVNGVDVTSKFTASASSATWTLGPDDQLVAGTVTIYGSIRDAGGHLASTSGSYEVLPSFQAIAPAAVHQGDAVTLSAWGLDPTAGANMAVFPDPFTAGGVQATFEGVDVASRTGSVRVPETAITGNLQLVVNGKAAPETLPLAIYGPIPDCGDIQEVQFTSDGGAVVHFFRRSRPMEPACPDVPGTAVSFVARLNPDRTISLLAQGDLSGWPDDFVLLYGFVLDKGLMDPAIFSERMTNGSASNQVQYKNRYLVGIPRVGSGDTANLAADFDREGNLYLLYYDDADLPRIGRLHLDTGTVTPVGVGLPSSPYSWNSVFVIGCDGFAYVGVNEGDPNPEYYLLFKVDLATGSVVSQMTVGGRYLADVTVSCQTNELLASQEVTGPEWHVEAVRFSDMVGPQLLGALLPPSWDSPVTVGPNGVVYLYSWSGSQRLMVPVPGGPQVAICEGTALPHCPCPPGLRRGPNQTCEQPPLAILPSTTRWKPQKDATQNVDIDFEYRGEGNLTSATATITGPSPVAPITIPILPGAGNPLKITWAGPWTTDSGNPASYLARGDYKIVVTAVKEDDTTVESGSNDPNATVSLVEVTKVELCQADDTDDCLALTTPYADVSADNPAVGTLPGQDPPQDRPGGGKRIFAEATAPGGAINNRVKVRAITDPVIPADASRPAGALTVPVYFKAFDVDDPAPYAPDLDGDPQGQVPSDNRGSPKQGVIEQSIVNVAAGQTKAKSFLQTSLQPGDNYRVAATTSQEWLQGLRAVQPSPTGELGVTVEEKQTSVSDMLTVWRTLHVETDSMGAPDNPTDPNYNERNFIRGNVTAIGDVRSFQNSGRKPTRVTLVPAATTPPLGLSDRSNDLSGPTLGCGRFEHGTIRLGVDAQAIVVAELDGNGSDFVQKAGADPCPGDRKGGMNIPFRLVDLSGGNALTGNILEWDSQTKEFTLSSAVGRPIYDGGKLTLGGVTWTVQRARGPRATVVEEQALPFYLVDDDEAVAPFTFSTSLLQVSDGPGTNLFAQAYMRPRYDVPDVKQAPFNRNVSYPPGSDGKPNTQEIIDQLAKGRDSSISTADFWTVYVQGAFQSDETADRDPNGESGSDAGVTLAGTDRFGALVFMETIGDSTLRGDAGIERCSSGTLVHELGHQFGLEHEGDGIMTPGCLFAPRYFTATDLDQIRKKGAAR